MRKTLRLNIKFLLTAYFFVLLTAGFFIYGVYWYINVPVDEKVEKYRVEQLKKQTVADESAFTDLPLIPDSREGCVTCHSEVKGNDFSRAK